MPLVLRAQPVVICATETKSQSLQIIRPARDATALKQVAQLRANAYYEDQTFNRFKHSFIKQYTEQEFNRLSKELSIQNNNNAEHNSQPQSLITLIATTDSENSTNSSCTATLDIKHGPTLASSHLLELPPALLQNAAYILNVVVAENSRGRGIGKQLTQQAKQFCKNELMCTEVYAHVEATNEVARRLYESCGFEVVGEETPNVGTSVGQRFLLRCLL